MTKLKLFLAVGIFGLVLLGAGCAASSEKDKTVASATASGAIKEFNVVAKQFAFEPGVITVKKGDTVRLTFLSQDVEHSFSLPAFNLNVDLLPGKTQTVEFVADKAGAFTFSCWVYCGAGHSDMSGKLVVE